MVFLTQEAKYGDYEFTKPYLNKWNEVEANKTTKVVKFR